MDWLRLQTKGTEIVLSAEQALDQKKRVHSTVLTAGTLQPVSMTQDITVESPLQRNFDR